MRLRPLLAIALFAPAAAFAADAANRCGTIKLEAGHVQLGKPLTEAWVKTPDGQGCLSDLVKEIDRHRLVRAVTVAAIVSDADRASGKGIASARAIADALIAAGLPKNRVFGLAPAPQRGDELGISIRYVERAPEDVVARVAAAGGACFLGAEEASLKPAEPGMPVLVNELVKTGPNAKVTIHLKDGSGVEVKPESLIKMAVLNITTGDRQVKIDVLSGGITADVRKATMGSRFEASSRVAVASVRGTQFRFGVEENGASRLETLEGVVAVSSATDPNAKPIDVPAGSGSIISSTGEVSPPTKLPDPAKVKAPLKGALNADSRLEWEATPGAALYKVEVARDADFVIEQRSVNVTETTVSWPEALGKGKWFWRVTAYDAQGFAGQPSKVYAFTTGK